MITFNHDGGMIKVTISPNMPDKKVMVLTWGQLDPWYAQLLTERLNKVLEEKLCEIRTDAYEKGWKDAKAKRAKETWFSQWW